MPEKINQRERESMSCMPNLPGSWPFSLGSCERFSDFKLETLFASNSLSVPVDVATVSMCISSLSTRVLFETAEIALACWPVQIFKL